VQFHLFVDTLGKSLDGDDGLAIRALGGIDARHNRLIFHEDGTRSALGLTTSDFGACEVKSLAEEGGKGFAWDGRQGEGLSVNCKGNLIVHGLFPKVLGGQVATNEMRTIHLHRTAFGAVQVSRPPISSLKIISSLLVTR
jgi:hypothetical protein